MSASWDGTMDVVQLNLLIPDKPDIERDAVAAAWRTAGGSVHRVACFWEPPDLPSGSVRLYGPDTFSLVVAEKLGLTLLEPDPYAVAKCPQHLLLREVGVTTLDAVVPEWLPRFIKPVVPKQFRAAVVSNLDALREETRGLQFDTEVLVSEVVEFIAEARSFVLGGVVQTTAIYEGTGNVNVAAKTCELIAMALDLPEAVVLDVGLLSDGRWAFVEANAAWGAGLNGCDPSRVVPCIAAATRTR